MKSLCCTQQRRDSERYRWREADVTAGGVEEAALGWPQQAHTIGPRGTIVTGASWWPQQASRAVHAALSSPAHQTVTAPSSLFSQRVGFTPSPTLVLFSAGAESLLPPSASVTRLLSSPTTRARRVYTPDCPSSFPGFSYTLSRSTWIPRGIPPLPTTLVMLPRAASEERHPLPA